MEINKDAFSSGQIGSKLWLCEELERTGWFSSMAHIYGGWHGVLAFLLLSRGKFQVHKIRSLDIDPSCQDIADMLNENWVIKDWTFKAFTQDCNKFEGQYADLIINTSTEHFDSMEWFNRIPKGTRVVLQGNDMPHEEHVNNTTSLKEFVDLFPLSNYMYTGEKVFQYPDWGFKRFMCIGIK
jgi:hypothetical protein